jgi:hypothetical protein
MERKVVENLDKALNFLYPKHKEIYTHDTLKAECFKGDGEVDVQAIIDKPDKDGCLHYAGDETKKQFKISIDGCILKERRGYKSKFFWDWSQRHQMIVSLVLIILTTIVTHTADLLFSKRPAQSQPQLQLQVSTIQKNKRSQG